MRLTPAHTFSATNPFRRCCAALMAVVLALQPLALYAAPITPQLANVPLQGLNPVKNNLMFTLDDSGSMFFAALPDYVLAVINPVYTGVPPTGVPPDPLFQAGEDRYSYAWCLGKLGESVGCALTGPPIAGSALNRIYYDPSLIYPAAVRSDGTPLPCEGTNTDCSGPWTAVYKDGFANYPNSNGGTTTNLLSAYPDEAFCSTATPTAPELATARTDGSVCRLNGVTYGGIGGYRYPSAGYSNYVTFTGNPYYYTITSVQFCDQRDANGWGTGTCGSRWSETNRYVSYGAGGFDPSAFTRVDITPSVSTYPSGRTYAQEMANFARWYAFARTRFLAMKTAAGIGFATASLDNTIRVGFHTINSSFAANFLNTQDFTGSYKSTWFERFYAPIPPLVPVTPSLNAMWRIGEYFSNRGGAAGLSGATDPQAGATGACRQNFHLFATDGFWSQTPVARSGIAGAIGNADLTVPAVLPGAIDGFTPGAAFPFPYREGSGANTTSDTMADIAMYYWVSDLRPDLPNSVKDLVAPWQHVVFHGLSLGAQGGLDYPSAISDLTAGTLEWPKPVRLQTTSIDDLWHAAVNGRGDYINAQNYQQLAEGIVRITQGASQQSGTATAVGLPGAQLTATKSFGYRTGYDGQGWWGDVTKYALDPNTGALPADVNGNPLTPPIWAAAAKVDAQVAGTGWLNGRKILTINDATGGAVPFRSAAALSPAQRASLTAGWSTIAPAPDPTAQSIVDFLRGDKSNEGVGLSSFRVRSHTLGDIVSSGAVPVGAPSQPYNDGTNPGYSAFASSKASRQPMVYVGSNDGMLHALIDANATDANAADGGKEAWAFIPKTLFSSGDPNDTAHTPSHKFQLGALSYRVGALGQATFTHQFYVNATPRIWDIDFTNTNTATPPTTGNDWHSILVGGLGAGGRGVYALDVTTPVALTDRESGIVNRVLWEISSSDPDYAELGYVYDAPTLVKTLRYGWVALVASGYNNTGGKGVLYVINPKTGQRLARLSTGVGSDAEPSGLSTIRAFTASRRDPYVLQAYGGDLRGNVWRFDLSSANPADWKVEQIAHLTDGANDQPITTGIRIEIDQNSITLNRYLFIGTGKLLGQADLNDNTVRNSLYVIKDGTRTDPEPAPATPYSRADLNAVNAATVAGFTGSATGRGWYQDALDTRQRIITDVTADVQTVVAVFSAPSSDPCAAALESTLYARDFTTGASVLESTGGTLVASIADIGAIAGVQLVQGQVSASGAPGAVRALATTMKGQVFSFGVRLTGSPSSKHRLSWRLITRD